MFIRTTTGFKVELRCLVLRLEKFCLKDLFWLSQFCLGYCFEEFNNSKIRSIFRASCTDITDYCILIIAQMYAGTQYLKAGGCWGGN